MYKFQYKTYCFLIGQHPAWPPRLFLCSWMGMFLFCRRMPSLPKSSCSRCDEINHTQPSGLHLPIQINWAQLQYENLFWKNLTYLMWMVVECLSDHQYWFSSSFWQMFVDDSRVCLCAAFSPQSQAESRGPSQLVCLLMACVCSLPRSVS